MRILSLPIAITIALSASSAFAEISEKDKEVTKNFLLAFNNECNLQEQQFNPDEHMEKFTFTYDQAQTEKLTYELYQFRCNQGAYNSRSVFYTYDQYQGPLALSFAQPALNIRYRDEGYERVDTLEVIGYKSVPTLTNANFTPETLVLTEYMKWRGVGDAASYSEYHFKDGEFILKTFDLDASYDGEHNLERVIDF